MAAQRIITDWNQVPVVMDLPFAARIMGKSPESLKARCIKGDFPAFKDGKLWYVEKAALRAYIDGNSVMRQYPAETISGLQATLETLNATLSALMSSNKEGGTHT